MRRPRAAKAIVPAALTLLATAGPAAARPDGLDAFDAERVVVVLENETDLAGFESTAPLAGLDRAVRSPGDPVVYELPQPLSRADLVAQARGLRAAAPNVVTDSGILVVPTGATAEVIMTDVLRVRFTAPPTPARLDNFLRAHRLEEVRPVPYRPTDFLVRILATEPGARDAANIVDDLELEADVLVAHPDYWLPIERRDDDYFPMQWHLANTGQDGGTVGADGGFEPAWSFATGDGVVVAVTEFGFADHPGLTLWNPPAETPGDGIDNDGNSYVDDVNGWDFVDDDASLENEFSATDTEHGTAVAGIVGAHRVAGTGVEGGAPSAELMILRLGGPSNVAGSAYELAFDYARKNGADVVNASWGPKVEGTMFSPFFFEAIADLAENGRAGLGCPIVFAMVNAMGEDECAWDPPAPVSDEHVIAVATCTNFEEGFDRGIGPCLDLLAPSEGGSEAIVTTSTEASADLGSLYTQTFGGNSAAAPQVAAAAALLIQLRPGLTAVQIRRILQDTADRIDDANAVYAAENGRSLNETHGFGRLNAYEAARLVADATAGGRGGADLLVRDNRLDWGNTGNGSSVVLARTPGFIPHWESPDIRVDAPPFAASAPADGAAFEATAHENPVAGTTNRVHVRVRNRGPDDVHDVSVRLLWTFAGAALPSLPEGFWELPPAEVDTSTWKEAGATTIPAVAYAGPSIAGTADDAASIVSFDWDVPAIDFAAANPRHYCLLAIVDATADPVSAAAKALLDPDAITPIDNNVAQRNVIVVDPAATTTTTTISFNAVNPGADAAEIYFTVDADGGLKAVMDGALATAHVRLAAGEVRRVEADVTSGGLPGDRVVITQWRVGADGDERMGGLTFVVGPGSDDEPEVDVGGP